MKRIFCLFFGIVFIVASFIPLCTYAGVKTNEYDAGIQDVGIELQSNFDIKLFCMTHSLTAKNRLI